MRRRLYPRGHSARPAVATYELLERRQLLSTVTINAGQSLGAVNTNLLGVNLATWDGNLNNSKTPILTQQAGLKSFRLPGGSTSDVYHWTTANGGVDVNGSQSVVAMANFIANQNAASKSMVTINYGTGSPEEGAAWLAYLNGVPSTTLNNLSLNVAGEGLIWGGKASDTTVSWVEGGVKESGQTTASWQTAGFWATLRTQSPISGNADGLNFLRIGRAQPYGFKYWEMGNEEYGTWETDNHGKTGDTLPVPTGTTRSAHNPTQYIAFSNQFASFAAVIDPTISIGISTQSTNTSDFSSWQKNILQQSVSQGFTPGFLSDHIYAQSPGNENDANLLASGTTVRSGTNGTNGTSNINSYDIAQRATIYRNLMNYYFGATASNKIELLATEFNSVSSSPGKQMGSLVNGLFIADDIGSMLTTGSGGYQGLWTWDLHNGASTSNNNASTLYGWKQYGDYGLLGNSSGQTGNGVDQPTPNYFALQLASKLVKAGGTVVSATSDSSTLDTFAVKESDGHLVLLIVNKSMSGLNVDTTGTPALLNETFNLNGFLPAAQAAAWQFGSAQDNAQKTGATALATSSPTLTLNGSSFNFSIPSYSMTVLDLAPAAPTLTAAAFNYAVAPNTVSFTFNQPLLASSISASDLMLTNLTTSGALPTVSGVALSSDGMTATFSLLNVPDGNYTATLPIGSVISGTSVPTTAAASFSFFSLNGDINHDGIVDVVDLGILSSNWQALSATFAQGDVNHDGIVDVIDLGIISSNWQKSLPQPAAAAASPAKVTPLTRTKSAKSRVFAATASIVPTTKAAAWPIAAIRSIDDRTVSCSIGLA